MCAPFSACGGDLVGTWQALSDCYAAAQMSMGCETIVHESATTRGTVQCLADGSYQRKSSETCTENGCSIYNVTSAWIPCLGRAVTPKSPE